MAVNLNQAVQAGLDFLLVRAADLALIISPGFGDYLVETLSGQRRDVSVVPAGTRCAAAADPALNLKTAVQPRMDTD